MEYAAGMDRGEADIEKTRRVVQVLRSAIHDLSLAQGPGSPESVVRSVLTSAVQRNIPAASFPQEPRGGGPPSGATMALAATL
jgi:hypothetical protein